MPSQQEPLITADELLEGVNQNDAQHLCRAFDIMASKLPGLSNSTALWAIATLLAKILADVNMDPDIMQATSERFGAMLRASYPAMVRAVEIGRREQEGRPAYDA